MDILFDAARWVNPARPSAAGLLPADPAPADLARLDAAADDATGGDIECDPSDWPARTDFHRFEPTPAERSWWARESARLESAREDREIDNRAAESAALDAMERGLIPPDVAAEIARTSIVGHDA